MCVICHKPVGVDLPSDETIKQMFDHNPHGAGFAIQGDIGVNGGFGVEYWKGFMKVEDFLEAIHSHGDLKDKRVVMHFRIKTSGETDAYTTHPFLMSNIYGDLRKLHGKGDVLFHNGVFSGLGGKVDKTSSDTQDFVIGVAMHHLREPKDPSPVHMAIAEKVISTCRVMILHSNRKYQYKQFGSWTKHTDGCEYSNMNWKPYESTRSYHYHSSYYTPTRSYIKSSQSKDVDAYGCNRAEFAWPERDPGWVNAGTITRFETITKSATLLSDQTEENGYKILKYASTGEDKWFAYPDTLDVVHQERLQDFQDYLYDIETLYSFGLDEEDEMISFSDEDEASEFFYEGEQIGTFTWRVCGKEWFFDSINLVAYTEKGIRECFKTGEQGHVRRYLEQYGVTDKWLVSDIKKPTERTQHQLGLGIVDQDMDELFDDETDAILMAHLDKESIDPAYGMS